MSIQFSFSGTLGAFGGGAGTGLGLGADIGLGVGAAEEILGIAVSQVDRSALEGDFIARLSRGGGRVIGEGDEFESEGITPPGKVEGDSTLIVK